MRKQTLAAPFFLMCAAACAGQPTPAPSVPGAAQPTAAAAPPRVLVTLVADQFAGWLAEERWPELPRTGGFARLLREGTWVKRMRYAHAVTDTAPGHSSLYTGVPPWRSGIYANEQLDTQGGRVSFLRDEATHVVTEKGEGSGELASVAFASAARVTSQVRQHDMQK